MFAHYMLIKQIPSHTVNKDGSFLFLRCYMILKKCYIIHTFNKRAAIVKQAR